jgi:hypothetical protein
MQLLCILLDFQPSDTKNAARMCHFAGRTARLGHSRNASTHVTDVLAIIIIREALFYGSLSRHVELKSNHNWVAFTIQVCHCARVDILGCPASKVDKPTKLPANNLSLRSCRQMDTYKLVGCTIPQHYHGHPNFSERPLTESSEHHTHKHPGSLTIGERDRESKRVWGKSASLACMIAWSTATIRPQSEPDRPCIGSRAHNL